MKWFSAYEERGVIALLKGVPKTKKRKPTRADDMKSVLNEAMSSFITFQRESEQRMLSFITFQRESEQRMLSFITFQRESEQRMLSFITFQRESEQRMLSFITFQRESEQRMSSFITFQRESEQRMSSFITFQRESEQRMLSFITFQRESEQRMLSFITFQRESEQRMLSFEERRMAKESETDDRRLGEAREHELVMYRLLAGVPSGQATPVGWAEQHAPCSNPVFSFTRRREHTKITFPLVKTTFN